jgi:hypothetical protein
LIPQTNGRVQLEGPVARVVQRRERHWRLVLRQRPVLLEQRHEGEHIARERAVARKLIDLGQPPLVHQLVSDEGFGGCEQAITNDGELIPLLGDARLRSQGAAMQGRGVAQRERVLLQLVETGQVKKRQLGFDLAAQRLQLR